MLAHICMYVCGVLKGQPLKASARFPVSGSVWLTVVSLSGYGGKVLRKPLGRAGKVQGGSQACVGRVRKGKRDGRCSEAAVNLLNLFVALCGVFPVSLWQARPTH